MHLQCPPSHINHSDCFSIWPPLAIAAECPDANGSTPASLDVHAPYAKRRVSEPEVLIRERKNTRWPRLERQFQNRPSGCCSANDPAGAGHKIAFRLAGAVDCTSTGRSPVGINHLRPCVLPRRFDLAMPAMSAIEHPAAMSGNEDVDTAARREPQSGVGGGQTCRHFRHSGHHKKTNRPALPWLLAAILTTTGSVPAGRVAITCGLVDSGCPRMSNFSSECPGERLVRSRNILLADVL